MMVWLPVGIAGLLGVIGAWIASRKLTDATESSEEARVTWADLDEQASHHIALLRDLNEQRDRLDPSTFEAERTRLEHLAADALRKRDAHARSSAKRQERQAKAEASRAAGRTGGSQLSGFLYGAATVGIAVLLFTLVNRESMPRPEGGSITGNAQSMPSGGQGRPHGFNPEIEALLQRVENNPRDLEALLGLTRAMLRSGGVEQAKVLLERAEAVDASHPDVRIYKGFITAVLGDPAGIAQVQAVTQEKPTHAEGWFFLGMLGLHSQNESLTRSAWEKYIEHAEDGPQKERIASFLRGEAVPTSGGGAPPPGHPPMSGEAEPDDLEGILAQAKVHLRRQSFTTASALVDKALAIDARNPLARVYQAVLSASRGDAPGALKAIDAVLVEEPKLADGWFFRGMLGMQSGDQELVRESWEKFVAVAPDGPQKDRIRGFLNGEGLQMPR